MVNPVFYKLFVHAGKFRTTERCTGCGACVRLCPLSNIRLEEMCIRDRDNTLVPHGAPADARSIGLFERLRAMGFSTCILSNNKEPRVLSLIHI